MKATPVIRWIGGKRNFVPKLAPQISSYLDRTGGHYYEPFVGGGAMALALGREKMSVSDVIEDLVNLYVTIRDEPVQLCEQLLDMAEWGTEEKNYYLVRDTDPGHWPTDVAARMVYLSAHSFNGLWRTNKSGQMNAAYGKKAGRITDELIERIGAAHEALKTTDTHFSDFELLLNRAKEGDLVYLDPPYHDTYVGYSGEGFNLADQERLALRICEAVDRGAAVLVHNSDTTLTRFLYEDLGYIVVTQEPRAVNRDGKGRGKTGCLLASNVPELLSAYA
jgi:DNA adenine methylase